VEYVALVQQRYSLSDLAEAEHRYTRALRNGERRDPENSKVALPLVGVSRVARIRGQLDLARSTAARALRLDASSYQALLHVALAAGDREEARRQVERIQAVADAWLAVDDPLRIEGQQAQALQARSELDAQRARPLQVLRLAEARTVLACVLGRRDPEGARLLRAAIAGLRAAKASGSADLARARWR